MNLHFVGHACVILEYEGYRLMTDPWFGEQIKSYFAVPQFSAPSQDLLNQINAIHISHIHRDHFCRVSLGRFRRDTPIFISNYLDKSFRDEIAALGFQNIVEIYPGPQGRQIGPFDLMSFQAPFNGSFDSSLLVRCAGKLYFFSNDCVLAPTTYQAIAASIGPLEVGFLGYNATSPMPCTYDFSKLKMAPNSPVENLNATYLDFSKNWALEHAELICRSMRPKFVVPYANGLRLRNADLIKFNSLFSEPEDLENAIGKYTQVVRAFPGGSFSLSQLESAPSKISFGQAASPPETLPEKFPFLEASQEILDAKEDIQKFLTKLFSSESKRWLTPMSVRFLITAMKDPLSFSFHFDGQILKAGDSNIPDSSFDLLIEVHASAFLEVLQGEANLRDLFVSYAITTTVFSYCPDQIRVDRWRALDQNFS